jgi:hypothetical protein
LYPVFVVLPGKEDPKDRNKAVDLSWFFGVSWVFGVFLCLVPP